jgi:hypothetical protein
MRCSLQNDLRLARFHREDHHPGRRRSRSALGGHLLKPPGWAPSQHSLTFATFSCPTLVQMNTGG